ncbi:MAG: hypothetical protein HON23_00935 [Rickettsiales bacterium]|jgi:5-carboxymethyl-2-hydroxymuconate isomerase|nr:hypothetical protein [Rickettsiales bacterium]
MPHIIIKHSDSIKDKDIDYQKLFIDISGKVAENDFCNVKSLKCYLMNPEVSYLPAKDFFIHVEFMILKRENLDSVNEKVRHIANLIKQSFPLSFAVDPEALSIEVRHMDPVNYHKGKIC